MVVLASISDTMEVVIDQQPEHTQSLKLWMIVVLESYWFSILGCASELHHTFHHRIPFTYCNRVGHHDANTPSPKAYYDSCNSYFVSDMQVSGRSFNTVVVSEEGGMIGSKDLILYVLLDSG